MFVFIDFFNDFCNIFNECIVFCLYFQWICLYVQCLCLFCIFFMILTIFWLIVLVLPIFNGFDCICMYVLVFDCFFQWFWYYFEWLDLFLLVFTMDLLALLMHVFVCVLFFLMILLVWLNVCVCLCALFGWFACVFKCSWSCFDVWTSCAFLVYWMLLFVSSMKMRALLCASSAFRGARASRMREHFSAELGFKRSVLARSQQCPSGRTGPC